MSPAGQFFHVLNVVPASTSIRIGVETLPAARELNGNAVRTNFKGYDVRISAEIGVRFHLTPNILKIRLKHERRE